MRESEVGSLGLKQLPKKPDSFSLVLPSVVSGFLFWGHKMFLAPPGSTSPFQAGRTKEERCVSVAFVTFYFNQENHNFPQWQAR